MVGGIQPAKLGRTPTLLEIKKKRKRGEKLQAQKAKSGKR
jgi:hypothetical protein